MRKQRSINDPSGHPIALDAMDRLMKQPTTGAERFPVAVNWTAPNGFHIDAAYVEGYGLQCRPGVAMEHRSTTLAIMRLQNPRRKRKDEEKAYRRWRKIAEDDGRGRGRGHYRWSTLGAILWGQTEKEAARQLLESPDHKQSITHFLNEKNLPPVTSALLVPAYYVHAQGELETRSGFYFDFETYSTGEDRPIFRRPKPRRYTTPTPARCNYCHSCHCRCDDDERRSDEEYQRRQQALIAAIITTF